MSDDMSDVTLGELIAHVGGVVHDDETVSFGSPMAVQAMLNKLTRHYQALVQACAEDCNCAVAIAKRHVAEVNLELAQTRLALHTAMQMLEPQPGSSDGRAHATPGVH